MLRRLREDQYQAAQYWIQDGPHTAWGEEEDPRRGGPACICVPWSLVLPGPLRALYLVGLGAKLPQGRSPPAGADHPAKTARSGQNGGAAPAAWGLESAPAQHSLEASVPQHSGEELEGAERTEEPHIVLPQRVTRATEE